MAELTSRSTDDGAIVECTITERTTVIGLCGDLIYSVVFSGCFAFLHGDAKLFAATTIVLAFVLATTHVVEESVLVMRGIGIQTCTVRGIRFDLDYAYRFNTTRSLVPRDAVLDAFTNEAILRWKIVDYIAIATRAPTSFPKGKVSPYGRSLHVIFPNLLPRLPVVDPVYRSIYEVLFYENHSSHRNL